jgi:hypothetical protein
LIEKLGLKFEKRFFMSDDKDELMLFVSWFIKRLISCSGVFA